MKALLLDKNGGPESFRYTEDHPMPVRKPGEVLIRIEAASFNRVDSVIRNGYPGLNLNFPHIIGGDAAGSIVQPGESNFKKGDRVAVYPAILPEKRDPKYEGQEHINENWRYIGMHTQGTYAEYISVPAENAALIPQNLSFEAAAALPVAGLTAYHAIETVAGLKPGDVFFMWGGSGGMGTIAIQLAKAKGCKVAATAGRNEKFLKLHELGADYVFNHYHDDVPGEFKKIFPGGADVIIDYVGPKTINTSLGMLRKNGRLLLCGMLTGLMAEINIQQFYFRHMNLHGLYLGSPQEFRDLLKLMATGKIKPVIDSIIPLKDAAKTHEMVNSGSVLGKLVISV
ncbi:MAG: zinc-binding dehydrogenase [Candidatus Kapaibacterium sp.]